MKKLSIYFLMFVLAAICIPLTSCKDDDYPDPDVIWDFVPYSVPIVIQDGANNLLDPNVPGNLIGQDIQAVMDGKTYPVQWSDDDTNGSRAVLAKFTGLTYRKSINPDYASFYLRFGDFTGGGDRTVSLQLSIPGDPNTYDIEASYSLKWKNKEPVVTKRYRLNGEEMESDCIIIKVAR